MAGRVTDDGGPERVDLKGTPSNPARDPKKMTSADKNEVGYIALKDCIVLVIAAWILVLLTVFSLRHFNV
jgi:hypothetical protein